MKKIVILLFLILTFWLNLSFSLAKPGITEGDGVDTQYKNITEQTIPYIKDLGFVYVRSGVPWRLVERTKGQYDWTAYDNLINLLLSNNIKPFMQLYHNNTLYGAGDHLNGINTEEQKQGFINYAKAVVSRYKGKGIIWEIWNEPNCGPFWKPNPDYNQYADVANAVIKEIHKIAPNEIIVAPAITRPNSREFLTAIGQKGVFSGLDGVSFHFYPQYNNGPESIQIPHITGYIREIVRTYNNTHALPIISSEAGYTVPNTAPTLEKQAQFLARQIIIHRANGINVSIWHNLRCASNDPNKSEDNYGLLSADFVKKPAYSAVKSALAAIRGKHFVKQWKMPVTDDYGYEFSDNAKNKYLFIWTRKEPHKVSIHGMPVNIGNYPSMVKL